MNLKSLQRAYRATNKAKTTPIITITHAPSVPPTIAGKLSDEDSVLRYFSASVKTNLKKKNNYNSMHNYLYCSVELIFGKNIFAKSNSLFF